MWSWTAPLPIISPHKFHSTMDQFITSVYKNNLFRESNQFLRVMILMTDRLQTTEVRQ